jgi:hypothetical protein
MPPVQPKVSEVKRKNHCRYFDFNKRAGQDTCRFGNQCSFWHVTLTNFDVHANRWVQPGEPMYVSETTLHNLEHLHTATKRKSETAENHAPPSKARPEQKKTDATEIEATSNAGLPDTITNNKLQEWLDRARTEPMMPSSIFLQDIIHLQSVSGKIWSRYPFEAMEITDPLTKRVVDTVNVHAATSICWSAMLYGSGAKIMEHLSMALVLGWKLRFGVGKVLESMGVSFQNVLFITESALSEDTFRAISFLWSVKFVSLPVVDEGRVKSTSSHLRGENAAPEHVFLKVEAFRLHCEVCVISDLDIIVTNQHTLAKFLASLVGEGANSRKLQKGQVAVLQREQSEVTLDFTIAAPTLTRGKRGKQYAVPVSYCAAIVKSSPALVDRYEQKMKSKAQFKNGVLSDQDLLGEVVGTDWKLLSHGCIMFPSWFQHSDTAAHRAQEVCALWKDDISNEQLAKRLVHQVGAIHLSKAFGFKEFADSKESKMAFFKRNILRGMDKNAEYLHFPDNGGMMLLSDWLHVLGEMWVEIKDIYGWQKKALLEEITKSVGHNVPGLGLSKMQQALLLDTVQVRVQNAVHLRPVPRPGLLHTDLLTFGSLIVG